MPTIEEKCPLCETQAIYYEVDHDDKKYYKCPNCLKFQVTINAETRLKRAPQDWKEMASGTSKKLPKNEVLMIALGGNGLQINIEDKNNVCL